MKLLAFVLMLSVTAIIGSCRKSFLEIRPAGDLNQIDLSHHKIVQNR